MNLATLAAQLTDGSLSTPAAIAVALAGGVVAGFGPCTLPVLPALFGYITGRVGEAPDARPQPVRGLAMAIAFVLGMSLVFSAIGAAAGLLGRALLVGSWASYAVAAVCALLGLQMLGVIGLPFERLNGWFPVLRPGRSGFAGALVFGMLFGLVASPCSTPILAAIATLAAIGGSAAKGGALLFVYGLGKGVPLLLLGLASGSLAFMRSVSRFTPALTKVGGAALLGAAAYLVWLA